jgi:hypothetical protein
LLFLRAMNRKSNIRKGLAALAMAGLALGVARDAGAQSLPEIIYTDLKHGVSDIFAVWTSPFRGSGSDYLTAAMLAGGVGLVAMKDDEIGAWIRNHPDAGVLEVLKPMREGYGLKIVNLGAGKSLLQLSGGLYLLGLVTGSQSIRDGAVGCTASEKSNGLLRHYIYKGVSRERPLVRDSIGGEEVERPGDPYDISFPGNNDGRFNWYDNSFFGGHGANIMACASFFNHRFDLGLAEPVIWAVAAGVNIGRVADQRHRASDFAVGAIVGFAMGKYVAERSLERAAARDANGSGDAAGGDAGRGASGMDREDPSALDAVLSGLFMARSVDGGTVLGWRGRF